MKFARKKSGRGSQFRVAPLEGVWAAEGCPEEGTVPPPESWTWRLRITVPADVAAAEITDTVRDATTKKGGKLEGSEAAARVFLEKIPEQRCGRILHIGPYADEPRSFAAMQPAIAAAALQGARRHIEIYLGDPQRSACKRTSRGSSGSSSPISASYQESADCLGPALGPKRRHRRSLVAAVAACLNQRDSEPPPDEGAGR